MAITKARVNKSLRYTVEDVPVSEIEVDHSVQRAVLDLGKIERIKRNYNENALGIATLSRRSAVEIVAIDGMHRVQVVKELTSGAGTIRAHVYTGLTKAEEAQMFLDLNAGSQPGLIDKFKVRLTAGDENAVNINGLLSAFGWEVSPNKKNDHVISCPGALERIYGDSLELEMEPNVLHMVLLAVTKAWGNNKDGAKAAVLEGLGEFFKEHGSKIDITSLIDKLAKYKGGPTKLLSDAENLASMRNTRVVMGVAMRLTDTYNVGKREAQALPPWRRRNRKRGNKK